MQFIYEEQKDYLKQFINSLSVERNLASRTLYAYRNDIDGLLLWYRNRKEESFDSRTILEYFSYLQREKRLLPKSIRRKYVSVQQYCKFLNLEGMAHEIFFRFSSRKFQLPSTLPKTLSQEDIKKLIYLTEMEVSLADSEFKKMLAVRNDCMIDLIYSLGLRIGEASAMNVEDYNSREYSVRIRGKGSKERLLYISSMEVREKMARWLEVREKMEPSDHAVFLNKYGDRISIYGIEKIFYKYRDMAGITSEATPHSLRHSFATQLLNNGAGIRDVQELLGHKSIVTTQIYTEVTLNRKKFVLEKYNGRNFLNISK